MEKKSNKNALNKNAPVNIYAARATWQKPFQVSEFSFPYSSTKLYIHGVWLDNTACKLTTTCAQH